MTLPRKHFQQNFSIFFFRQTFWLISIQEYENKQCKVASFLFPFYSTYLCFSLSVFFLDQKFWSGIIFLFFKENLVPEKFIVCSYSLGVSILFSTSFFFWFLFLHSFDIISSLQIHKFDACLCVFVLNHRGIFFLVRVPKQLRYSFFSTLTAT